MDNIEPLGGPRLASIDGLVTIFAEFCYILAFAANDRIIVHRDGGQADIGKLADYLGNGRGYLALREEDLRATLLDLDRRHPQWLAKKAVQP